MGQREFSAVAEDEDSLPKGEHVKALLDEKCKRAQNKQGLPLLPQERSCAREGGWKRTGEIAAMKGKERPYDLQTAKNSL